MFDLTILMPCLNEEENIAFCVDQAQLYLSSRGLSGQILVVDNDSTDRSAEIASAHGATVIKEHRRGYGRALRTGLAAATGDVIIFGDCDSTYDFANLDPIYYRQKSVIGNLSLKRNKYGPFQTEKPRRFPITFHPRPQKWSRYSSLPFHFFSGVYSVFPASSFSVRAS